MAAATSPIGQSIEMLCSEQGLDRDMVIEAMKDAVRAAARKHFKTQDKTGDSIQVEWNTDDQDVEVSIQKTVVLDVENPSAMRS
jgi:N utilization substance protein A